VKNFENGSIFGDDMEKVCVFFWSHPVHESIEA